MSNHFNGLTPAEAERLALLLEEMGEAQQAIGKILRHGYESRNPDEIAGPTNRMTLARELGDVRHAIGLLVSSDDISLDDMALRTYEREKSALRYLHHQVPR